jgi:hypothetical protein
MSENLPAYAQFAAAKLEALRVAAGVGALLPLTVNGESVPMVLGGGFQFHPLNKLGGFMLARLLSPVGHSCTQLRGVTGAHSPRLSVPQAVRVEVQVGELLWWQQSQGEAFRLLTPGDVAELAPNEVHSYHVVADCQLYSIFTPALDDAPEYIQTQELT